MRLLTRLCFVLFVALLPLLSSPFTPNASASNFTVNSLGDTPDANTSDGLCADANGACTLRAAIQQANADPPGDVIGFSVTGVVNLTSALPTISKNVTINGPGAQQLTVRRNTTEPYRIFTIGAGVKVTIAGLTVTNGLAPVPEAGADIGGGGIYNAGELTLHAVTVNDNATASALPVFPSRTPAGGGGIQNDGVLTMTGCTVSNNTASLPEDGASSDGGRGGGILNTGTLVMTDCAVSLNHTGDGGFAPNAGNGGAGGGVYSAPNGMRQVSASLTNCLVNGNTTGNGGVAPVRLGSFHSGDGGNGGGIYNASNMTIVRSTISNNLTGVGASVRSSRVQPMPIEAGKGGAGGGIYNDIPSGGGELKMTNCVVVGNKTGAGGAGNGEVQSHGDGGHGGGIANPSADSVLKVSQCTIISNQTGLAEDGGGHDGFGGGIYGVPRVRSSIVALNFVRFPSNASDVAGGPFLSSGYNYMGFFGLACCFTSTDRGGAGGETPLFIKLDTATLVPLLDSPLLDAALARDIDDQPVTTDRRGAARPFDFSPSPTPQPGGDDSDVGAFERQDVEGTPVLTTTVQFAVSTIAVSEDCIQHDLTLTRSGLDNGTTVATYVFRELPLDAHQRGDFTYAKGQVTFAPGENSKTIPLLITEDAYKEEAEPFNVQIVEVVGGQLGTPNSAIVVIHNDDEADGTANPIDDNATFVCQHYHDFLSREADASGRAFWTARLDECNGDAACLDRKRVDVSAAFFLSVEFLNTGYYVIRVNKVGLGDAPSVPAYFDFLDEAQDVARGVVVGQPGFDAVLEANKQRYAEAFVQRANFLSAHAGQTAEQYVGSLFRNVGVTPTAQERDAAVSAFGVGDRAGRTAALRSIVESGSVYNRLYNESFVLMQYFGYLRRNPNAPPDTNFNGYQFWLDKLDAATLPGEDARDETAAIRRIRRAEMVRAFLRSTEYRGRFGGDPSRGNP